MLRVGNALEKELKSEEKFSNQFGFWGKKATDSVMGVKKISNQSRVCTTYALEREIGVGRSVVSPSPFFPAPETAAPGSTTQLSGQTYSIKPNNNNTNK